MIGFIPHKNGDALNTVQSFLQSLLESNLIEALYVPLELEDGTVLPALVTDPAYLEQANPFAPAMPINGARAVSALTQKKAPAKLGVVLRPCEIRALFELVKLQQACLEDALLIGLDCPGTFEIPDYLSARKDDHFSLEDYLAAAVNGEEPVSPNLRQACQMCVQPIPENVDIHILNYGMLMNEGIFVKVREELAESIPISPAPGYQEEPRRIVIEKVLAKHQKVREAELGNINQKLTSNGTLAGMFSSCLRCHNCSSACPVCYCKTCLFRTAAFDHPPEHYLNAANRKGATRLLGDALLFHLTRLNHMAVSCVGCGMCTSACPVEIPVGLIFSTIGSQVQAAFDYSPGRDLQEPLPLVTFQADEWNEIGESK